jgi:hypothetical protein
MVTSGTHCDLVPFSESDWQIHLWFPVIPVIEDLYGYVAVLKRPASALKTRLFFNTNYKYKNSLLKVKRRVSLRVRTYLRISTGRIGSDGSTITGTGPSG